jgi:tRNA dimethylallyltransferase
MNSRTNPKVLMIVGPTGVGKTALALKIANAVKSEIISTDSRLLYRGMDIGTDKPSPEVLSAVKHHLINVADPDDTWTLSKINGAVIDEIDQLLAIGKLPILVGGTGQYFRSLIEGWEIPELKPNLELRKVLENWGKEIGAYELHQKLSLIDKKSGISIQPQNIRRTVRALEVVFSTGKRFSDLRKKTKPIYDFKVIGLTTSRDDLYQTIDKRIDEMFAKGFIKEVEDLAGKGYTKDLPSMSAIGYHEIMQYLAGKLTVEEVKIVMKRKTRQFVRRQSNWFNQDNPLIEWITIPPDPTNAVIASVRTWMKS